MCSEDMTIFKFYLNANVMLRMKLNSQVKYQREPFYLNKSLLNLPIPSDTKVLCKAKVNVLRAG